MLTFDDPEIRQEKWNTDKFAAFRSVFERFNQAYTNNMSPDDYVAIDETLYLTKGQTLFKTYNKDKPTKYGLNIRSLGSSKRPSVYYTIPFTGKPVEMTDTHKRYLLISETVGRRLQRTRIFFERYKDISRHVLRLNLVSEMAV